MNRALDRRLKLLEGKYEEALQNQATGCCWPDYLFWYYFRKKWPDLEKAPPIARMAYKRLDAVITNPYKEQLKAEKEAKMRSS